MQGRGRSTRVLGCRLLRYLRHQVRWLLKVGGGEEGAGIDGIKTDVAGLINGVVARIEGSSIRVHQVVHYREALKVLTF